MAFPSLGKSLDKVSNRYLLVVLAAKRARQINNYYNSLGEGLLDDDFPPPLVTSRSKNLLTISLEEVAEGKIGLSHRE